MIMVGFLNKVMKNCILQEREINNQQNIVKTLYSTTILNKKT